MMFNLHVIIIEQYDDFSQNPLILIKISRSLLLYFIIIPWIRKLFLPNLILKTVRMSRGKLRSLRNFFKH
jgi:hypothetical protein